ncbi:diguanylate cyclase (GGDEF)-like protein [Roseibium hamelinense]|uniref:diguanylate cyclase n=1 Tax=Roseibium hamelinense TaxID=150831 RepID=A0A562TB04_9HYPH|nr:diguanylate cyclase [Roseibium hamelinense]MTI45185.1 diguanylate cyclase [Roseibium hamelinense]TWI90454.1 diguanylate cyclase (GGDEF)-like protein [Roseibium hamelinense]
MKINTLTNLAYGITLALTFFSGLAFILSIRMAHEERQAVEVHLALADLGAQLELDAELRTDEARLYVMRGDLKHLAAFETINEEEHRLEEQARHVKDLAGTEAELALLAGITTLIDGLEELEVAAITAYQSGNPQAAREILFGDEHYTMHVRLVDQIKAFTNEVTARTALALQQAQIRSELYNVIARVLLGVTALVFLAVLYFVLRRRVALPLTHMSSVVRRLAKQDFEVEVPADTRRDEIGDLTNAIRIFRENGLERERLDAERKRDLKMKGLILEMMRRMQACQKTEEIAEVVACFGPQVFADLGGAFFILNETKTVLWRASTWQMPEDFPERFDPEACWSLRRGRAHHSLPDKEDVQCQHFPDPRSAGLCIPLMAHGDALGLLVFSSLSNDATPVDDYTAYLGMIAENVGLALANLQLRDRLTRMAVCDPLTGLLNRRSLDESLATFSRENDGVPLTCMMIDIDYFKRFNDEFGHDAGDAVMITFAGILAEIVGERGLCYRFGGEEFSVLFSDISREEALEIAEHIRTRTATTALSHSGRILGTITVSIGLADTRNGGSVSTVRTRSDVALMHAKTNGRNRTVQDMDLTAKQVAG